MNKRKFNSAPEFIRKIDWSDLRGQKAVLIKLADTIRNTKPQPNTDMVVLMLPKDTEDVLEGILGLIDAAQDYAVDVLGIPEMHVYDFELEEERENSTAKKETKTLWLCGSCGSDNVEHKAWVKANTNEILDSETGDDLGYCADCGQNVVINTAELKASAEVVGFQVVDDERGEIHPTMEGSFCLYNLSQAREMLEGSPTMKFAGNWKLLTIWTGDVEDATPMFEGDPRD
jgi:hypothetical protein